MAADITVTGHIKVGEAFDSFTRKVQDKHLKRAVNAALAPMARTAKAMINRRTGTMQDSIDTRVTSKGTRGQTVRGFMGPKARIRAAVSKPKTGLNVPPFVDIPTRRAHLLEFGHKIVSKGQVVGQVKPVAWANDGGDTALDRMKVSLENSIATEPT